MGQCRFDPRWLAIWLLIAVPASSAAQEPLTTREMERLTSRQTDRRVKQDLLSILQPVSKVSSGMFRTLHGVAIAGRPFGTEYSGLCQADTLSLAYRPARDGRADKDLPVEPYGMEVSHSFHLMHLPHGSGAEPDYARVGRQPSCDKLSGEVGWFAAPDAETALRGLLFLKNAVAQARAGLGPAPKCDPSENCEARLTAAGDLARIRSVERCAAEERRICYNFSFDSSDELTIDADGTTEEPGKIRSITITQYVVVT